MRTDTALVDQNAWEAGQLPGRRCSVLFRKSSRFVRAFFIQGMISIVKLNTLRSRTHRKVVSFASAKGTHTSSCKPY
jgi:hypothetical protein